jgi:pimeloyl-ACP methyl ester carboxylesterase
MIPIRLNHIFPRTLLILMLSLSLFSMSCRQTDEDSARPEPEAQPTLISATLIGEFSPDQIRGRFTSRPEASLLIRNSVRAYKIVYNTPDPQGKMIRASGALLVPVTDTPAPVLSFQHGTITNDHSAPSNYESSSEIYTFGTILASTGYVISAPDYIGYGESRDLPHPYEHAHSLASASLDMLRAVKEYTGESGIQLNGQLFLAGYSEGGYATMALHKLIEEQHADEFTVTASAPGAGAYNKTSFARDILASSQPLQFISNYLWVLDTYNRVYDINQPLTYYLNEPYATRVQQNGVNATIDRNPQQLFTPAFRESIANGTNSAMLAAFADNDVYDWAPKAPMRLYHGTEDDFVPFYNSQDAYDAMQRNGATQVELRRIEGGNHFTSIPRYTLEALFYFANFQAEATDAQ